ncbi:MAG: T9SS type A sorting domain-containing protein [Bacteroidales bacterium]
MGDVYKLVFKAFDYTIGKTVFQKSLTSLAGISMESGNDLFSVFPNPAGNYIVIESDENFTFDEVNITDVNGKTVLNLTITSSTSTIAIDQLNNGLYFVIVTKGNETHIQKLMIRK